MNNYLLQLLKEIKTIIIPGLGALTLTNEATGEMMFMPYLKYDDGTLAKHIAEKENMDLNDAKNLIAKFVREVMAELDKGSSYDMYQFGTFRKVDGDVAFEQWNAGSAAPTTAAPAEATPVPTPEPSPIPEKPEPPIAEAVPVSEPVPTPVVEEKKPEPAATAKPEEPEPPAAAEMRIAAEVAAEKVPETAPPAEEPAASDNEIIPEKHAAPVTPEQELTAAAGVAAEIPATPAHSSPASEPKKTLSPKEKLAAADAAKAKKAETKKPEPTKKEKSVQPHSQPAPKKKRRAIGYILWGVIVLLLGGATYVAVNFDTLKKDFPILADLAGDNNEKAVGDDEITTVIEEEEDTTGTNAEVIPLDPDEVAPHPVEDETVMEEPEPEPIPAPAPEKPKKTEPSKPKITTPKKPRPATTSDSGSIGSPDPSRPYHVIGGSFGSEANAKRFARELIAKGQPSVVVGEFNGMYRVSVASFATKEEAMRANNELQGVVAQTWVFRWP